MITSILLLLHPTVVTEPSKVENVKTQLLADHAGSKIVQQIVDRFTLEAEDAVENSYQLVYYLAPVEAYLKAIPIPTLVTIFKVLDFNGEFKGCLAKPSKIDAIMNGFVTEDERWVKPAPRAETVSILKRKTGAAGATEANSNPEPLRKTLPLFKRASSPVASSASTPSLPSFKKLSSPSLTDSSELDEYESDSSSKMKESKLYYFDDEDEDDELLDDNELLIENGDNYSYLSKPVVVPIRCELPNGKKRRKACKDCTCGLKEQEELEEAQQRDAQAAILGKLAQSATAEAIKIEERLKRLQESKKGSAVKIKEADLNEIDFTIEGKTGGCNSCSLGDAFRCDGCPFLGLPAFKPGQEVTIFEDDL